MLATSFAGQGSFATRKKADAGDKTHLAGTTITNKHELEGRSLLLSHFGDVKSDGRGPVVRDVNKAGFWRGC